MHFSVDAKHFENGAFRKQWRQDNRVIMISLLEFSSNTNPKWPMIVAFQISPALCGRRTFDKMSISLA